MESKRAVTYPLRLCPSIRTKAEALAKQEGISLNHFISLALAEKLSRMEHESWLQSQNLKPKPTSVSNYVRPVMR